MKELLSLIEDLGWKGQIVSIDHLNDLRDAIINRLEQGQIDKNLYQEQLSFFSFNPPSDLPGVRSMIIVAVPTPQMRIFFHSQGKLIPVIIPPTYVSYTPRTNNTQNVLTTLLKQQGYHLSVPQLPLKTLAVQSGLAKYGRNNICYVEGMGSFLQLVGAFTDIPCDTDQWYQPQMLDRCEKCTACLHNCPTKAICEDRFLLHAENCLTFHNESANDFPGWINPEWHHCLIGCLKCQSVCPENKTVIRWFEDRVEFSELETALFLKAMPFELLPKEMELKVGSLEINESYQLLCRNLKLILDRY
jgi:epoxyqueuosine reductase